MLWYLGAKHFQKDSKDQGNNVGAWKSHSRTSKPVDETGCCAREIQGEGAEMKRNLTPKDSGCTDGSRQEHTQPVYLCCNTITLTRDWTWFRAAQ